MPYDKSSARDRASVTARLQHWFDRVPSRAVDQWMAVWNAVFKRTGDEGRAFAAATSTVHRRFPAQHAAFLSPAVTQGAKVLATVLGKKALRELELTLQSCQCGQDHARTLAMVQAALRVANAAVGNDVLPGVAKSHARSASDPFEGRAAKQVGVNVAVVWNMIARDIYANGDKLFLAVREMLQNSRDARASIISIQWTPDNAGDDSPGTLTFTDNGRGMDAATVEQKFLVLGESWKEDADALGGFGAAKAAILTASETGWSWDLRTRNVWTRSDARGTYMDPLIVGPDDAIQGTRITIPKIKGGYASTPMGSGDPVQRISTLIACCDLRGLRVLVNGRPVTSYFDKRRAKIETEFQGLSWGDFVPEIRSYARESRKDGAIIVRVKGLAQFALSAPWGAEYQRDYVLDFEIPKEVNPHDPRYPFKSGRDTFRVGSSAWTAFKRMTDMITVKAVQNERDLGEYEEIRPDNTDPREQKAQEAFDDLMGDVLGGEKNKDTLAELAELTDDMQGVIREALTHGQIQPSNEAVSERPVPPPPLPGEGAVKVFDGLISGDLSEQIDKLRALADSTLADGDVAGFHEALKRLRERRGYADDLEVVSGVAKGIITRLSPNVSGLYVGALVSQILRVLEQGVMSHQKEEVARVKKRGDLNPFGGAACIFVSRARYGVEEGRKFRRGARKFMRHLAAWDFTVRAIMQAAATQSRWPRLAKLGVGFVLDSDVLGLTDRTGSFVMVNPHALGRVAESYKDRPFIVAAWIHGLACHEIAHAMQIHAHASSAHNEDWSIVREMLADSTLFLLPVIEDAAATLLRLKRRRRRQIERTPEAVDARVAEKLAQVERDLAEARVQIEEFQRAEGQRTRIFSPEFGHKLARLIDIWEFQDYLRNNPDVSTTRGIPVQVMIDTLRSPRGAEDLMNLLDQSSIQTESGAASSGRTALARAGARWREDARRARLESNAALGHAACPGCGGTCDGGLHEEPGEDDRVGNRAHAACGCGTKRVILAQGQGPA